MEKYQIEKFLSEISDKLLYTMLSKKSKILLIASMGSGKTDLVIKNLYDYLRNNKHIRIQLIVATSNRKLVRSIVARCEKEGLKAIASDGAVSYVNLDSEFTITVTTPESFYKVKKGCEDDNRPYYIIYDEVHQIISDGADFRIDMDKPLKAYDDELCWGFTGLTATPDNIKGYNWDKIIFAENLGSKQFSKNLDIFHSVRQTPESIASFIIKYRKLFPKAPIVGRINNKELMQQVKELLNKLGIKCLLFFTDQEETEAKELMDKIVNGETIELPQVLLMTSLMDAGVEIHTTKKPIVIPFMNENSTLVEEIQFIGRFRNGIELIVLAIENKAKESNKRSYKEILEKTKINANAEYEELKEIDCLEYPRYCRRKLDKETETYYYEYSEVLVLNKTFYRFISDIIRDPKELKKYLENHETFKVENIEIKEYEEINYFELEEKERKKQKKADKEAYKEEKESYDKWSLEVNPNTLEAVQTKEVTKEDQWKKDSNQDKVEFYWSDRNKPMRELNEKIQKIKGCTISEAQLLRINGKADDIILEYHYSKAYGLYNTGLKPNIYTHLDFPFFNEYYTFREIVQKIGNGKERDIRLGEKNLKLILEEYKKKRKKRRLFKIEEEKTLNKHLLMTYNVDTKNQIRSIIKY